MTGPTPRPGIRWPARRYLLIAALLVAGLLLLAPIPGRWTGGWRATLLNLGHVPLFATLVVAWTRPGRSAVGPAMGAIGLALAAEAVQKLVGRSASLGDFLRGAIGALAAAAAIQAWRSRGRPAAAVAYLGLAAGLVAWPVAEAGPRLIDAWEGTQAFPVLAEFRTDRELLRWHYGQAALTRTEDPGLRLEFQPGPEPYPGATLEPVAGDFRDYRWLCCSFEVESGPLDMVVAVRDRRPAGGQSASFQEGRRWDPGPHVARLDLPAIAARARPRPLDLSDVRAVQFFVIEPPEPRAIRIHRIWLED